MPGMLQLLRLIDALGEVVGRKKLQKIVHILKSQGHDFPQHFGFLHYGPFSSEVAAEMDSLVRGKLVNEKVVGQQFEAYVYKPEDAAKTLLKDLKKTSRQSWQSLASQLNQMNVADLEAMSTILYLQANGFSGDSLKTRFSELKPSLKGIFNRALKAVGELPNRS